MLKCLRSYWPYILLSTRSPKVSFLPVYPLSWFHWYITAVSESSPTPPKTTGKPRHSRLWRIFKGQRLLHVYVVSLEESRQGERGGTKTFRNFTQFLIRWEGERKDCLGRLFLVNMGPSKWKKQNTTFLEKRKYDQIPYLKGPMLSLNVTTLG